MSSDTLMRCIWRPDEYVTDMLRRVIRSEFSSDEITRLARKAQTVTMHAFCLQGDNYDKPSGRVMVLDGIDSIFEQPVLVEWSILKTFRGHETVDGPIEPSAVGLQLIRSLNAGVTFVFSLSFQWG